MKLLTLSIACLLSASALADCVLRADTAATLKVGPFLDSGDGITAETGLTISQADVRLSKNGGNIAQKNESTACTHDELGYYDCPVDTTDTNTEGRLLVAVSEAGAVPVWHECVVKGASFYDLETGVTTLMTSEDTGLAQKTTVATLSTQTSFTLTAGSTNNNAYNNMVMYAVGGTETGTVRISGYVGSTKTITLYDAFPFTLAVADSVWIYAQEDDRVRDDISTVNGIVAGTDTTADTINGKIDDLTDGTTPVPADGAINCTVNTANFAGSSTTLACILTTLAGGSITAATSDLTGKAILVLSGTEIYEVRYINTTTWDAGNSELQLTLSRALNSTLADAVTVRIW